MITSADIRMLEDFHGLKEVKFVTQSELRLVTAKVSEMSVRMAGLADRQRKTLAL